MSRPFDVAIAGDGPAGLVAATLLARAGARVAVLGRVRKAPRRPGETLPGAGQRLLRVLGLPVLEEGGPHRQLTGISSAWDSGRMVETDHFASPDGPAWLIDRDAFDRRLEAAAVEAGARIFSGGGAVARSGTGWTVATPEGPMAAAFLVDATGRAGRLARRLGPAPEAEGKAVAWWSIARGEAPTRLQRPMIERTGDGWWFAVRLGPDATYVAFHTGAKLDPARRAEIWQARLRATKWLGPQLDGAGRFGPVRGSPAGGTRLRQPCGEAWAACGDAAMALDPLSSQGLLSALAGGHEVAKALCASTEGRKAALEAYRERLDQIWSIYQARRTALMEQEAPASSHAA